MPIFTKYVLPLFGVFGTLITTFTFLFPKYAQAQVILPVYVSTILFLLLLCSVFILLYINAKNQKNSNLYFNNFSLIPVQYVVSEKILILNRATDLPLGTAVSIYYKNGMYESLVSIGYVFHIQENLIQIKSMHTATVIDAFLNDSKNLNQVIIKPLSDINTFNSYFEER